jgi:transcriptional regulator GlxA family with amidase domain
MVARILDLLFIQICAPGPRPGHPAELAGRCAGSADRPGPELARACSLSQSAFAARFAARAGKPPASYLAHVRLDAATSLLRDTSLPVTVIAANVGYTSEAAFSRAFKHHYRTPPARWRREARAGRW